MRIRDNTCEVGRGGLHCRLRLLVTTAAALMAISSVAIGQSEEGVRAAFLFNFAKFTEWPASAFADDRAAVVVGFIGADALAVSFERNVAGKNVNGRDFVVKRLDAPGAAENCHIVFVGDPASTLATLGVLKGKPVLLVGEGEGFVTAGGMIGFIKDGARVSFDLDLQAAGASRLRVDSKVRQIARRVRGG